MSHPVRIAWISFTVLALELALIRLIPAEIKAISYFTNLLLFSSFFGLGVGCILHAARPLHRLLPIGVFLLASFLLLARGIVVYDTGDSVHYWLQKADASARPLLELPLAVAAGLVFALSALPFVALGQALARTMDRFERLRAYSWDILGSLAGTLLFAASSYAGVPPWLWVAVLVAAAPFVSGIGGGTDRILHALAGAAFLAFAVAPHAWHWSPYYFVQYEPGPNQLTVWVNSSFHQEAINFGSQDPAYRPTAEQLLERFGFPYAEYRRLHGGRSPERVLVLGAGTGNDVAVALRNGAQHVTAVEIDPVILELGRTDNPERPYAAENVTIVNDDGRHFLWNTREKYDLIVFGTLDSQTLLSGHANLRLENYIYTRECFEDAREALNDGGMVAAYYSVFKPWFVDRIYATLREAFPDSLLLYRSGDGYLFNFVALAGKELPSLGVDPKRDLRVAGTEPSSDDWPYIYLERRTLSPVYLQLFAFVGALILAAFWLLRRAEGGHGRWHLDFFFLGVGFTLLEAAAVVRLALAFGATWVVTAVVFSAALLTVFLANRAVMRRRAPPLRVAWIALLVAVAANYAFPVQALLGLSLPLRVAACAALVGLPVYFAAVCFSRLFEQEERTGYALGINLVGAMTGGLLEYFSMVIGMRAIWVVLACVYLLAFVSFLASRGARPGCKLRAG